MPALDSPKGEIPIDSLLRRLPPKARRGSKPRCYWLTQGNTYDVARRLTDLVRPWAVVSESDQWMPMGFEQAEEAQLHDAPRLLAPSVSETLSIWWFDGVRADRRTPNFDIASTCTIDGRKGLLLVEAKAHVTELTKEAAGRSLESNATAARRASHEAIGRAIEQAAFGLTRDLSAPCRLSRDRCYQMANRFAWAWKLATLEIPVVLVYLGLLRAGEMADRGAPFESHATWDRAVREHSAPQMDDSLWNNPWMIDAKTPLIPLIASSEVSLDGSIMLGR